MSIDTTGIKQALVTLNDAIELRNEVDANPWKSICLIVRFGHLVQGKIMKPLITTGLQVYK